MASEKPATPASGASQRAPATRKSRARRSARRWLLLLVPLLLVVVGASAAFFAVHLAPVSPHSPTTQLAAQFDTSLDGANPAAKATAQPAKAPACNCAPAAISSPAACDTAQAASASQVIIVCLQEQWLFAYQDGQPVFNTAVETGRAQLPTPPGTYSIFYKGTNLTFTSPFPPGSPFWYYPTHINYAMEFRGGGFFLHDAWWHEEFGPGSNVPHQNPDGTWETGSHGCVGMTIDSAKWLYGWTKIGTTVIITPA